MGENTNNIMYYRSILYKHNKLPLALCTYIFSH